MVNLIMLYIGGALTALWGISHLFPAASVVRGFGDISVDNKRIITMEWIIEGVALIFIGLLVIVVTVIDSRNTVSTAVYILSAGGLIVLAIVSLFTGFKVSFLPYRLCPFIFSISALLILAGAIL